MNVNAFNKKAERYGIRISPEDPPIDRLVKASIYLSRKADDDSRMLTNREYVDMTLEAAAEKAKGNSEVYDMLVSVTSDAVREILEFHGRTDNGRHHVANLLRFNGDGVLEPVDEILIAPHGWTRVLGRY